MQAKMVDFSSLFEGNEDVFYKRLDEVKMDYLKLLEENKKLDPVFVDFQKKNLEEGIKAISEEYKKNREAFLAKNKLNNTVSPSFEYVNHKGGKTKLEDFKGKYVYIDLWATWCGPCRAEIPFLQKTEEEYHDKNIVFVSISIDKQIDFEKWKAFVTTQNLGGIQLIAEKDWSSEFVRNFGIKSIPRFILIDPKGIVVKGDAPRPSNPKLKEELDKLLN